jgi:hypothetical protein
MPVTEDEYSRVLQCRKAIEDALLVFDCRLTFALSVPKRFSAYLKDEHGTYDILPNKEGADDAPA